MCETFFNDKFSKIPMLSKNKYAGFHARFNHGAGFENTDPGVQTGFELNSF